jgi:hypothetical protein
VFLQPLCNALPVGFLRELDFSHLQGLPQHYLDTLKKHKETLRSLRLHQVRSGCHWTWILQYAAKEMDLQRVVSTTWGMLQVATALLPGCRNH